MTIYTEFKLKFMHIILEKTIYQVIQLRFKNERPARFNNSACCVGTTYTRIT